MLKNPLTSALDLAASRGAAGVRVPVVGVVISVVVVIDEVRAP